MMNIEFKSGSYPAKSGWYLCKIGIQFIPLYFWRFDFEGEVVEVWKDLKGEVLIDETGIEYSNIELQIPNHATIR